MASKAAEKRAAGKKKPAAAAAPAPAAAPARTTASRATSREALKGGPVAVPAGKPEGATAGKLKNPIKVEATQMGWYGLKRRRIGDVFLLEDPNLFSHKWMKVVDGDTPEKITTGNQDLRRQHDEILQQKIADAKGNGPDVTGPNPLDV